MKSQANYATFSKVILNHCISLELCLSSNKEHIFYFIAQIVFDGDFLCNSSLLIKSKKYMNRH